jgi:hypothetical protein
MNKETWLTAQDALKNKFVDEIMFDDELKLVASVESAILPQEVISKIANLLKAEQLQPPAGNEPPPEPEEERQAPLDLYAQIVKNHERRLNHA